MGQRKLISRTMSLSVGTVQVPLRLDQLAKIDDLAGPKNRSKFVREAIDREIVRLFAIYESVDSSVSSDPTSNE